MKELTLGKVAYRPALFGEKEPSQLWVFEDVFGRDTETNDQMAIRCDQSFVHSWYYLGNFVA
jgi:hypothetical protein